MSMMSGLTLEGDAGQVGQGIDVAIVIEVRPQPSPYE